MGGGSAGPGGERTSNSRALTVTRRRHGLLCPELQDIKLDSVDTNISEIGKQTNMSGKRIV